MHRLSGGEDREQLLVKELLRDEVNIVSGTRWLSGVHVGSLKTCRRGPRQALILDRRGIILPKLGC